jgi:tetratricopeptide (TPR) repeat protein
LRVTQEIKRLLFSRIKMNFFPIFRFPKIAAALFPRVPLAVAVFLLPACKHKSPLNLNISTPVIAVETLDAQSPYFTESARAFIATKKPQWISAHETDGERRALLRAEQDPELWRQLDRSHHFDAVLLCGDPGEYRLLLNHLIDTKDWTLTYLDHTSMVFRRAPAKKWSLDDLRAVQQKFADYPASDRAVFHTQAGAKLLAIGQPSLGKQQLDEALGLDNDWPETWTQLALYESNRGKWNEALSNAGHALKLDPANNHALATKAQILYSSRRFSEALEISNRLVGHAPDNPNTLFFHAKIAHEAHAFEQEIATLKHLVEIVEEQRNEPAAGFRIYLAQAYAKNGQGAQALDQFEKALAEGGLSSQQLDYIKDSMQRIKSRTAL